LDANGFFNFLPDDVNNFFDDFSTFGLVPFGPIVIGAIAAEFPG
jgi:hypothetical protein